MPVRSRWSVAAFVVGCCCAGPVDAQYPAPQTAVQPATAPQVTEEVRDGIKYQVTRQVMQQTVPTTVMQDRQQTVMTQQVTTETIAHQQVYSVPVTQYEMVGTLHGRWNPFVEPYWTYEMQPVTYYQEQVANVQIPMNKVTWVPQTKTVQVPVTEYRTAEQEIVTRVAMNAGESAKTYAAAHPQNTQGATGYPTPAATPLPTYAAQQPSSGYGQPPYNSTPSATIATRPTNQSTFGGQMLQTDPPRQGTGWSTIPNNSGYR